MQLNKNTLFHLSIFTLVGFSLIGYIVLQFNKEVSFFEMMLRKNWLIETLIGLGVGGVAAGLGLLLLKIGPFQSMNSMFGSLIKGLNPKWYHILFYSFCAGVGEEILFRGAIQSFFHIWPTAIFFVLIHGYITPKDWKMSIYGVFLIFISGSFGYLMKYTGIYSAMAAHFLYDVIMFSYLKLLFGKKVEKPLNSV